MISFMEYHLSNERLKALFAWRKESGISSIYQLIIHLDYGPIINNHESKTSNHIEEIYCDYYSNKLQEFNLNKYMNFKTILFWRNPYKRILSEFFQHCELNCIQITEEKLLGFIQSLDNSSFCESLHHFENINKQIKSHLTEKIVLLPESYLPSSKLFHDRQQVKTIYEFLWKLYAFNFVSQLYKPSITPEEQNHKTEIISKIISTKIQNKLNSLLSEELRFFKDRNIEFNLI